MKTADALKALFNFIDDSDLVILSDGKISTESLFINDSPNHFYMLGSMGQASMIGLGVAIGKPGRRIFVIEGDGNLLMNPASLIVNGQLQSNNLVHVVIDNGVYETTGSQPTMDWDILSIVRNSNYKSIFEINLKDEKDLSFLKNQKGPVFLKINVSPGSLPKVPAFDKQPSDIVSQFRSAIKHKVK